MDSPIGARMETDTYVETWHIIQWWIEMQMVGKTIKIDYMKLDKYSFS